MMFKIKIKVSPRKSISPRKPRSRFLKAPCKNCNSDNSSCNKNRSPCIMHYFINLSKKTKATTTTENDLSKNEEQDNRNVGVDIGKVNEDISHCINGGTTLSADAKNGEASKIYRNESVFLIEVEQRELTNNLNPKFEDCIVDNVTNTNFVESNEKSKTRNKRKSIPIKRSLEATFPKRLKRTEKSSKPVEIVNPQQQNHHTPKDSEKIIATNHVQLIKQKTSKIPSKKLSLIKQPLENGPERSKHALDMPLFSDSFSNEHDENQDETRKIDEISAIAEQKICENLTEEVQNRQSEEKMKSLDELPIIINDKRINTSNKSRHISRMLELFGSDSEDSDQSVDCNVHDVNNNTQDKSSEPYLPMKELHQIVQDVKDDSHTRLKKLKYSSESIEISQIELHKHREPSEVNERYSNKNYKSNSPPSNVKKNVDGSNKLKSGKGKNLMFKLKNKHTQTDNTPRRPRGRPLTKPVMNFIVTPTEKKHYDVKSQIINKKYSYVRYTYDLGPNPRPKFRIVPKYQPYTFKLKKTTYEKYPNTTWSKLIESGHVVPYSGRAAHGLSEKNNRNVISSNQLLEKDQTYESAEIEKRQVVNVIEPNDLKEFYEIEAFNVETQNPDMLFSHEQRNIDILVNLYDDIEPNLFGNNAFSRSSSCNSSGRFSVSKVFRSIGDGYIDPQEESEDKTSLETFNYTFSNPPSDQVDGVNILTSLSNYRQDMQINFDNLIEKLHRSFVNLFNSITSITEGSCISSRLMLESLNGQAREDVSDVAKVTHTAIDKNLACMTKPLTLSEYSKQIKVKCSEESNQMPQDKDNSISMEYKNMNKETNQDESKIVIKKEETQKCFSGAFSDELSQDKTNNLTLPENYKENEIKYINNFTHYEELAKIVQSKDNCIKKPKKSPLEKSEKFISRSNICTKLIPQVSRTSSPNKQLFLLADSNHQNLEFLFDDLLKMSQPINDKKDIDQRAMMYHSLKQKLELERTNLHPALYRKLREDCMMLLRRYIFSNTCTTELPLPLFKSPDQF